jgi:AraC-like DNA-binding protein
MLHQNVNSGIKNPNIFKLLAIRDEITAQPNREKQRLPKLCLRFNLRQKALANSFKRSFGCSLAHFVKEHCLCRGLELLSTRMHERVYDIALLIGYADESSFTRAFKKRFNTSPGEYRRRLKLLNKMSGMAQ